MGKTVAEQKQTIAGACFCGQVKFTAELPSKWCAHCHCSMCRRIHGAGYVTWVGFEKQQIKLQNDHQQLQWYESSPGARRGFCKTCGSSMFFESIRWESETHVALACINEPIDRSPQAHAFHNAHVDWMSLDPDLAVVNP